MSHEEDSQQKKSIALILAIALLVAVLFHNAIVARRPSLIEHSAVISADHAAVRAMPSRFTLSIGVCLHGQHLTIWMPSIFDLANATRSASSSCPPARQTPFRLLRARKSASQPRADLPLSIQLRLSKPYMRLQLMQAMA